MVAPRRGRTAENGVRSVDIRADKVPTANILLALRVKDLTYSADLPLTGELKGELGRDGLPTYFRGKITAGAGNIIDTDTPDYPMAIDSAEMNVEWDAGRRVLVAPFKIISGREPAHAAGPSRAAQRQRHRLAARFQRRHDRARRASTTSRR